MTAIEIVLDKLFLFKMVLFFMKTSVGKVACFTQGEIKTIIWNCILFGAIFRIAGGKKCIFRL